MTRVSIYLILFSLAVNIDLNNSINSVLFMLSANGRSQSGLFNCLSVLRLTIIKIYCIPHMFLHTYSTKKHS